MRCPPPGAARAPDLAAPAAAGARARRDARVLGLLALGHLSIDMNQGALPALLPFLKASFGLSYSTAGVVRLVANATSSLIRPALGHLADRASRRWLLPWALVAAAGRVALLGWIADHWGLRATLPLIALLPLAGFALALLVPEPRR